MRLFLAFLAAVPVFGQDYNLTPETAVARALEAHPLLKAGQARIDAAGGVRRQAAFRPNPRLFLQSENTRLGGAAAPFRFARETDNFAYASQVFEAPGKRDARVALTNELIRRRELEVETLRAAIFRSVSAAYWSAAGAEHVRDLLRQNLDNFEKTLQYHRDRVREGAMAEADLIRMEVEKEQVSVQLQNAEQDVRRLRLQLFREMGEPEDQPGAVLTGELQAARPFIAGSLEELLTRRRDLQLGHQIVQQARAAVRLEQANAKPDTEVLFGYKRSTGFNTLIAGVQAPLPFWNRNQGSIAASLAEVKAAEYDLRSAELGARSEILSAQSDYRQKFRLVTETLPKMRAQAEDTVRIARAVYREGASDLLRLLDAERTALQAQLLSVRTLIDYHLALAHLQAVTGMMP